MKKREREYGQGEGQRERQRNRGCTDHGARWASLDLRNWRSWPELKPRVRCLTDWASQRQFVVFFFLSISHNSLERQSILCFFCSFQKALTVFLDVHSDLPRGVSPGQFSGSHGCWLWAYCPNHSSHDLSYGISVPPISLWDLLTGEMNSYFSL